MNLSAGEDAGALVQALVVNPARVIFFSIGFVGVLSNIAILAALFKSKQLRNFHVGGLAAADCCVCINFMLLPWNLVTEGGTPQRTCIWYMSVFILALQGSATFTLTVGLDRVLMVVAAQSYQLLKKVLTRSTLVFSIVYSFTSVTLGVLYASPRKVPLCTPPTALFGSVAFDFWNQSTAAINITVVFTYSILVLLLKFYEKRSSTRMRSRTRQMILSILIALVHISTTVVTMFILFISKLLATDPLVLIHAQLYAGSLAVINSACNAFIYFGRSKQYRDALLAVFGKNVPPDLATQQPTTDAAQLFTAKSELEPENEDTLL